MTWVCKIGVPPEAQEKLEKIVKDITARDAGFKSEFQKPEERHEQRYSSVLCVFKEDKDDAHRVGTWFAKKTNLNLTYWIDYKDGGKK